MEVGRRVSGEGIGASSAAHKQPYDIANITRRIPLASKVAQGKKAGKRETGEKERWVDGRW